MVFMQVVSSTCRIETCRAIKGHAESNPNFFSKIIRGDELGAVLTNRTQTTIKPLEDAILAPRQKS